MKSNYSIIPVTEFGLSKQYEILDNDAIGNTIKEKGCWEEHITEFISNYIKPEYNCLDIGANFGYHTVTMGMLANLTGAVFSFEPMKIFSELINKNLELNNIHNVIVYNNAVGNEQREVFIQVPCTESKELVNHGDSSISNRQIGQSVEMITIDLLSLPKINFVKLDVQGSEILVLEGARQTIAKDKPVMIVEIESHQLHKFGCTAQDLVNFIKTELEYDMYQMVTAYPADFLCVPKNTLINKTFNSFSLKQI